MLNTVVKLMEMIAHVKLHVFRNIRQCTSFNEAKSILKSNELVIHVDFSENYANHQRGAIQSAYFGRQSFVSYTVNIHFREENLIKKSKFCFRHIGNES